MSTTQRQHGGNKRSSWITFHRRLFLVRRLIRGPATAATLIAEARATFDDEIYPPDARAALRHDMAALRAQFECVIRLRKGGYYALEEFGHLAVLDLPDEDLEALAFLAANFRETPLPNASVVDALLDRIIALLPAERRRRLQRTERDVRLDYPVPSQSLLRRTLDQIRRALALRQQVSFAYRSSYARGDTVVVHRVAPYDLFFRDGHHYLEGYCYDCGVPEYGQRYRLYRLDRMVADSVRILPEMLGPLPPRRTQWRLVYELGPAVAGQRDIALWFPNSEPTFATDGSAIISAQTTDLWQARQILLRYREHCRVLEPPELVEMLRESIARMAQVYDVRGEQAPVGLDEA